MELEQTIARQAELTSGLERRPDLNGTRPPRVMVWGTPRHRNAPTGKVASQIHDIPAPSPLVVVDHGTIGTEKGDPQTASCIPCRSAARPLIGRVFAVVGAVGAPIQGRRGVGFRLAGGFASRDQNTLIGTDAGVVEVAVPELVDDTTVQTIAIWRGTSIIPANERLHTVPVPVNPETGDTHQANRND